MAMSGIILPFVGMIGLVGNVLVIIVYTSADLRIFSTSIYLTALAMSDFSMIIMAMFLFVLEAWRNHGPISLFEFSFYFFNKFFFSFGLHLQLWCAINFSVERNISNNVCIFLCSCSR